MGAGGRGNTRLTPTRGFNDPARGARAGTDPLARATTALVDAVVAVPGRSSLRGLSWQFDVPTGFDHLHRCPIYKNSIVPRPRPHGIRAPGLVRNEAKLYAILHFEKLTVRI